MLFDQQLIFSDAQALTATANSTNYVDGSANKNLNVNGEIHCPLVISAKGASTPTIRAVLVGADDTAFSTNKITIGDTGTLSDPTVGIYSIGIRNHSPKRYYRIEYTLGGGGGSPTFTVTVGFTLEEPSGFGLPTA